MEQFDVIIIGGGPGGSKAAKMLSAGGKQVALIEDRHLGGVCLNCGCIPTKLMLGAVAPRGLMHGLERQRVAKGSLEVDFASLKKRVQRFTGASSQTLAKGLTAAGVRLYTGRAVCRDAHTVDVLDTDGQTILSLAGQNIILAGGSRSAAFPGLEPDHNCVLDSTDLLNIPTVPESLLIVGAGAIGLEMADFFNAMGSTVTVVEAAPQLAPTEDADIAQEMEKLLRKNGLTCLTAVKAVSLVSQDDQAVLTLEDGRTFTASKALVAVGRKPNTDGLGAESAGCTLNRRGFVQTDDYLRAAPTVFAIGDINGRTLLAHAAEHQAAYVARQILGLESGVYESGPVPSCIYGSLEVMRVGLTVRDAQAKGGEVAVSRAPLIANPIAQAGGDPAGFVKVVWHEGRMVGIAALGHHVSHLVT
ncbi:MAG: NAD(P)/FAD-dependent oxidoreductase, partial [Desulfovibrionaceae bacterium]|nr:NAD(P)/FAD-dependent oxidoreductase [Desulfovibrionaceae bacterium]